jgi:phenylalanyl-tRNA synthetase beta chain
VHATLPERPRVELRSERVDALLGLEVPVERQAAILDGLGFDRANGTVTVPTWRARDVTREIDLVEEIARFELDLVPFTLPVRRELFGRLTHEQRVRREVEDVLVGCGLSEAYTPSLVADDPDPEALRLPLPLSSDQSVLRTTLLPSLLHTAARNREVGNAGVALFEIARVYLPTADDLPQERWRVAGVLEGSYADAKGVTDALFAALKIDPRYERGSEPLLHPGKAARVAGGWVGEIHPGVADGWAAFELDLSALAAAMPRSILYEDVITFPSVLQDLAFVVDEDVPAAELIDAMRAAAGPELREVSVFDEYRGVQVGEGKRSLAFRVAFGSPERTLTDEEAAAVRTRIVDALRERFGAAIRSG